MSVYKQLKSQAISLRKQGFSYREIQKKIPVSKSTLSLWLRTIELGSGQKKILEDRWRRAYLLGALASKNKRIEKTNLIKELASQEIGIISKRTFKILGAMLYWGEGSKQKETNPSQGVEFVNSDPIMSKFIMSWMQKVLSVPKDQFILSVYMNETKKAEANNFQKRWARTINIDYRRIRIYFTKDRISKNRRLSRVGYMGELRIRVKRSTDLNRKIAGWIEGVCRSII